MTEAKRLDIIVVSDDKPLRLSAMVGIVDHMNTFGKAMKEELNITVHASETKQDSLLEVMQQINPQLQLVPMPDATKVMAGHIDDIAKHNQILNGVVENMDQASQLLVSAALTDSHPQKTWYIDQALQKMQGENYPQFIEGVKEQQLKDGVIDLDDAKFWEWDKGMAP